MIGDYGACFGKMGGTFGHSKYQLKGYAQNPPVITSVNGRMVALGYKGSNASYHESVPLEGARLFADRAAGLSLKQVEDAFRAAPQTTPSCRVQSSRLPANPGSGDEGAPGDRRLAPAFTTR
jgi:hypothetical protein